MQKKNKQTNLVLVLIETGQQQIIDLWDVWFWSLPHIPVVGHSREVHTFAKRGIPLKKETPLTLGIVGVLVEVTPKQNFELDQDYNSIVQANKSIW